MAFPEAMETKLSRQVSNRAVVAYVTGHLLLTIVTISLY